MVVLPEDVFPHRYLATTRHDEGGLGRSLVVVPEDAFLDGWSPDGGFLRL